MKTTNLKPEVDLSLAPATQAEINEVHTKLHKRNSALLTACILIAVISSLVFLPIFPENSLVLPLGVAFFPSNSVLLPLGGALFILVFCMQPVVIDASRKHERELSPIPQERCEEMLGYCMTTQVGQTYLARVREMRREFIGLEYEAMKKHAEAHKAENALAPDEARRQLYTEQSAN